MKKYHAFMCHAKEDKEEVALPLTRLLQDAGLDIWIDKLELTLGDSLSKKINEGLSESYYGIVILSEVFFAKNWTLMELNSLIGQMGGNVREKIILPVWHKIDDKFIRSKYPILADMFAVSTDIGIKNVAKKILNVIPHKYSDYSMLENKVALLSSKIVPSKAQFGVWQGLYCKIITTSKLPNKKVFLCVGGKEIQATFYSTLGASYGCDSPISVESF